LQGFFTTCLSSTTQSRDKPSHFLNGLITEAKPTQDTHGRQGFQSTRYGAKRRGHATLILCSSSLFRSLPSFTCTRSHTQSSSRCTASQT
jgi:hypothetical protein